MKTIFPPTSCDRNHAILIRKWVITKYYSPPTCCVASTGSRNNFHVFSNVVQFRIDFQTYSVIKVGGWRSNMCLLSFAPDLKPKRSNCQTTQTNRLSPWIWFIDPLFIDRHSLRNVFFEYKSDGQCTAQKPLPTHQSSYCDVSTKLLIFVHLHIWWIHIFAFLAKLMQNAV